MSWVATLFIGNELFELTDATEKGEAQRKLFDLLLLRSLTEVK